MTTTTEMNPVEKYLRAEVAMMGSMTNAPMVRGYYSMGHFVLNNGQAFSTDNPIEVMKGTVKECYRNASMLALHDRRFTYCEGWAVSVIPVMHAWLIQDGRIGETTWSEIGHAYYGIPFKTSYLRAVLMGAKHYGLIDRWKDEWPLLREPKELWHHDP